MFIFAKMMALVDTIKAEKEASERISQLGKEIEEHLARNQKNISELKLQLETTRRRLMEHTAERKRQIEASDGKWCVPSPNNNGIFIGSDGRIMTFDEMMDSEYYLVFE